MQLVLGIAYIIAYIIAFFSAINVYIAWNSATPSTSDWGTVQDQIAKNRRKVWISLIVFVLSLAAVVTIAIIAAQNGWDIYPTEM